MKTLLFKICIFILSPLLFASCLDSSNTSIVSGKDVGYVTSVKGVPCLATSSGYITSPLVSSLIMNECYLVAYEITMPDKNGIYTAEALTTVSKDPLPQTILQEGKPIFEEGHSFSVKRLEIPVFAASDYMGDRWLFNYIATVNKSEHVSSYFYYDKENQVDRDGKNISGENKIIIDIAFKKTDIMRLNTMEDKVHLTVGNLEQLRTLFKPDFSKGDTNNKVNVLIQFRYRKYVDEQKPAQEAYLGTWSANNQNKVYYMTFSKE